jgi:hypothetical protein
MGSSPGHSLERVLRFELPKQLHKWPSGHTHRPSPRRMRATSQQRRRSCVAHLAHCAVLDGRLILNNLI